MTRKAHALALALLLAAFPGAVAAADVVVLQNGARLEGRVLTLDGETVVLEQAAPAGPTRVSFPRDQVKAIEFASAGGAPDGAPPAATPAATPGADAAVRDEWWLLRADGAVRGTRRLTLVPHADEHGGRWRLEEHVRLFGGPRVPGVRVERIEDVDAEFRPRHVHYRELGEPAAEGEGGLPGYETIRSGPVEGGAWTFTTRGSEAAREGRLALPPGTTTPLALRETLARAKPRKAEMASFSLLDPAREDVRPVRAGFVRLDAQEGDRREDVLRIEDGSRVFESRWVAGDPPRCVSEDLAGFVAVPSTKAQAEAAAAADGRPTPPPPAVGPEPVPGADPASAVEPKVPEPARTITVAEAGLVIPVPGASWTRETPPPPTDESGRRVVAKLWSSLHAADVRVEFEPAPRPKAPADARGTAADPAPAPPAPPEVEAALLARLRRLSPDLSVVEPRAAVASLAGAWRMTLRGTRNGERVRVLVMVAEGGAGRATVLATCPEAAWGDAKDALESVVLGFRWL